MDTRRRFLMLDNIDSGNNTPDYSDYYTIDLNDEWKKSDNINNPDSSRYDGVYESYSNYNINNGVSIMTVTITGLNRFTLYIRSYAETGYDYVMVSQLDVDIDGSTSYLYSAAVKAHTRNTQNSGTDIYSYTPITYDNIGGGEHKITIVYLKDSGTNIGDDRGYILIDKNFEVYGSDDSGDLPENTFNINNYMTIEALEDGLKAKLDGNNIEYCIDGSNSWLSLSSGVYTQSINTGQKLSFRGNGLVPASNKGIGTFSITKQCKLTGNCNSLLFGDNAESNYSLAEYNYAFYKLFYNCTSILYISSTFLPAMSISNYCYGYMFYGCSNLIDAPDLPALTLVSSCYYNMYNRCSSLINPGEISATTLATYCCYSMYYNCTSLQTAPVLYAEVLPSYCYYYMFSGCNSLNYIKTYAITLSGYYPMYYWMNNVASTGDFYKHPDATWSNTGVSGGVPDGWKLNYIRLI